MQVPKERVLRVKKAMLWRDFRSMVATAAGCAEEDQRLWTWNKRENCTYRCAKPFPFPSHHTELRREELTAQASWGCAVEEQRLWTSARTAPTGALCLQHSSSSSTSHPWLQRAPLSMRIRSALAQCGC